MRNDERQRGRLGGIIAAFGDQSEWQIEWQTTLPTASSALVDAKPVLGFCLARVHDQQRRNDAVVHGKEKGYGSIP
jgi:hypothetical protein